MGLYDIGGGRIKYIFRVDDIDAANNNPLGTFICHIKIDEWERPTIGTQLKLPTSSRMWQVTNVSPTDNPAGNQNTYYVKEI